MSILTILKYDDPALRGKAAAVKRINKSILRLLDDMLDTMRAAEGVGLAANQIGVLQRVVVIDIGEGPIELINPAIVGHAGTEVGIEACLSVPGLMGEVERAERITIKALDRQGKPLWLDADGLLARVLQHELDHLEGVVFVDRASSLTKVEATPRLRTVFMGTSPFAVPALRALAKHHEVLTVITRPDRPAGRRGALVPPAVKLAGEDLDLPVWQPDNCRSRSFLEELGELTPDILVVASFGEILPRRVLELPEWGAVNVHASLLPRHRGAAPIQRAIMDGDERTGVTLMRMVRRLDAGDMIMQASLAIRPDDTTGSLEARLAQLGAKVLVRGLRRLLDEDFEPVAQCEEKATYAPSLQRQEERIQWGRPAVELERQIRALQPQPGAYALVEDKRLKVLAAEVVETVVEASLGLIIDLTDQGPLVACGRGALVLTAVQVAGGRPMDGASFLHGRKVQTGDLLK